MNLVALTEKLIASLVKDKEAVTVKEFDTEEEGFVLIEAMVAEEDMGRVIGKAGRTAKAIRTIVQASAYLEHKKVKINIESF